jgi:phage shock protein A
LQAKITDLKQQQADYLAEKKRVSKELKNAQRKRRRLKEKARSLSDADLAEVIALRAFKAGAQGSATGSRAGTEPGAGEAAAASSGSSEPEREPGTL